jgi:hypothetical protein
MLGQLIARWRPKPIATAADLADFIDQSASVIAQKSVIGYCQVKTNLPLSELTRERQFADAFERGRWEAFAAVVFDLVVVSEMNLRAAAGARAAELVGPLARLGGSVLARHPVPAHRPDGWSSEVEALHGRLARNQLAPRISIARVAEVSAERIYETLPIHERLREPDKPAIVANVQFLMVGLARRFESGFRYDALAADLLSVRDAAA